MPVQGRTQLVLSLSSQCVHHQHLLIPRPQACTAPARRAPPPYQVPLSLGLRLLVVPRLVPERLALPHVLEDGVDERLADEDAQVHDEEHVHRPETQDVFVETERPLPRDPELAVSFLTNVGTSMRRADGKNTAKVLEGPPDQRQSGKGKLVYI